MLFDIAYQKTQTKAVGRKSQFCVESIGKKKLINLNNLKDNP